MKKLTAWSVCFVLGSISMGLAQTTPATAATKETFVNSLGMEFVPVPGTKVLFSIWDTRVQDYRAYAEAKPGADKSWSRLDKSWTTHPGFKQREDHPVVDVNWNDANAFCAWLTRKERKEGKIGQDQEYRLPAAKEWSVAAGPGKFPWGNQWPPPKGAGNFDPSMKVDDYKYTSPVGHFAANGYGLFDMGGDVYQWCEDLYDPRENYRVLRGSSWATGDPENPFYLWSSGRNRSTPERRDFFYGFRCVLAPTKS